MRLSALRLGGKWGELDHYSGVTRYQLSPFEQRAFAGAVSKGLPNIFWRIRSNIFRVAPRKSTPVHTFLFHSGSLQPSFWPS